MANATIQYKNVSIEEFEVKSESGGTYVYGYANTKGNPDAYGDIPYNLNGQPVYDLSRFAKNPVALVDHKNSVGHIFGTFVIGPGATEEDEKGLRIKLRLMDDPQTDIARHAVHAFKSGFARAFSIGGQWEFNDPENKSHLTKAYIHEISGVAIPADEHSLSTTSTPKNAPNDEATEAKKRQLVLESLVGEYRATGSKEILNVIKQLKKEWDQ